MEDYRNNFKVEKTLRTATGADRARMQIGRISPFGLLELSRQRLRTSIVEHSFEKCSLCKGTGMIRNKNSITEQLFKVLAQYCAKNKKTLIEVKCNSNLADEILNNKKDAIFALEKDYECKLNFIFENSIFPNEPQINVVKNIKEKETNVSKKKIPVISGQANKKNYVKKNKKSVKKKNENKKTNLKEDKIKNIATDDLENTKSKKGWWIQSTN